MENFSSPWNKNGNQSKIFSNKQKVFNVEAKNLVSVTAHHFSAKM